LTAGPAPVACRIEYIVSLSGDGLGVRGDDSAQCFGTGVATEPVVARGTVRRERGRMRLENATVCAP
jgi:hypothetical protein